MEIRTKWGPVHVTTVPAEDFPWSFAPQGWFYLDRRLMDHVRLMDAEPWRYRGAASGYTCALWVLKELGLARSLGEMPEKDRLRLLRSSP